MATPSQVGNAFYLANAAKITTLSDGTVLTTFLSNSSLTITKVPTGPYDITNKSYVDSQVSSEASRARTAESSLTSALASELSRATVAESSLTSALGSELSRATAAESSLTTALASELSRATVAESSLTTALASELSRATVAESSLTTALASEASRATAAESSLHTYIDNSISTLANIDASQISGIQSLITMYQDSDLASLNSEISRASAAESSLTTRLTSEASRATAAESSLTTSLASEASRATAAESSLTTRLTSEASRATAAESTLTVSLASEISRATASELVLYSKMVRTEIMPLNNVTIGGASRPQYCIDLSLNNPLVDGWKFRNTDASMNCQFGNYIFDNAGKISLDVKSQVNQVYVNLVLNQDMSDADIPSIVLYTVDPKYSITGVAAGDWYNQKIRFTAGKDLKRGSYTFVANISGSNTKPTFFTSPAFNQVVDLCFNVASSESAFGVPGAKQTDGTTAATTVSNMKIDKPMYYVTVQSSKASAVGSVDFILSDIFVEINSANSSLSGTTAFTSGTYDYKFSDLAVSSQFMYSAVNNLYNQFYKSSIKDTVFPGNSGYTGFPTVSPDALSLFAPAAAAIRGGDLYIWGNHDKNQYATNFASNTYPTGYSLTKLNTNPIIGANVPTNALNGKTITRMYPFGWGNYYYTCFDTSNNLYLWTTFGGMGYNQIPTLINNYFASQYANLKFLDICSSGLLDTSGQVYYFDYNNLKNISTQTNSSLIGKNIVKICANRNPNKGSQTYALDDQGLLHTWMADDNIWNNVKQPKLLNVSGTSLNGKFITNIFSTENFFFALDSNGQVHFGYHISDSDDNFSPLYNPDGSAMLDANNVVVTVVNLSLNPLNSLYGKQVISFPENCNFTTSATTAFIDSNSEVHTFRYGFVNADQAYWGDGTNTLSRTFQTMNISHITGSSLVGAKIKMVSVGGTRWGSYTIALDSLGKVHFWGDNIWRFLNNLTVYSPTSNPSQSVLLPYIINGMDNLMVNNKVISITAFPAGANVGGQGNMYFIIAPA